MFSGCLTENQVQDLLRGALSTARVDGVDAHLDGCLNCQLLVSAGVRTTSLRTHGFERAPVGRNHLEVGQVVSGRYRITRFIARGGMGEVYAAYDEMLAEEIALKILLRPAYAGAAALDHLRGEVQLARRVLDPHVLRVFDIGSCQSSGSGADGELLFLTMQLLQGETLRERIRRAGPLAPTEVWRLADGMLAALGAAHQQGIIHRDFKSENVMLVPTPAGPPEAVVMDFGLAKTVAAEISSDDHAPPLVAGTVGYMAPEQLSGGAVTAAADVYAFGVVLYEMLTGVLPPFRPRIGRGAAEPPPLPLRLDGLDIPSRWKALIRRCLARDPAARFRDMNEARHALVGRGSAKRRLFVAGAVVASLVAARATLLKPAPAGTVVMATRTIAAVPPPPPPGPARPPAATVEPAGIAAPPPPKLATRPLRRHANAADRAIKLDAPAVAAAAPASLERAEALLAQGKTAEACAIGEMAAEREPERAPIRKFMGGCLMRLADPVRAREHYRKYLTLAPDDPDAVFIRAIVKQNP